MSVHTCSNISKTAKGFRGNASINACLQGFCPFDDAKVGIKKRCMKLRHTPLREFLTL